MFIQYGRTENSILFQERCEIVKTKILRNIDVLRFEFRRSL